MLWLWDGRGLEMAAWGNKIRKGNGKRENCLKLGKMPLKMHLCPAPPAAKEKNESLGQGEGGNDPRCTI